MNIRVVGITGNQGTMEPERQGNRKTSKDKTAII
jgi:hypothetical protein